MSPYSDIEYYCCRARDRQLSSVYQLQLLEDRTKRWRNENLQRKAKYLEKALRQYITNLTRTAIAVNPRRLGGEPPISHLGYNKANCFGIGLGESKIWGVQKTMLSVGRKSVSQNLNCQEVLPEAVD
jgi:hypothetical protein